MYRGLYFLLAFFVSASLIALLKEPAYRLGWVDRPDARKHHREPVPTVGGAGMYAAFCLLLLLLPERPTDWTTLVVAAGILTAVGIYDDVRPSSPLTRFFFQISAALLMTSAGGLTVSQLGDLFGLGIVLLEASTVFFTIFCVVGVINAFNMSDGLDGLAGGLALVATGWLIVLSMANPLQSQANFAVLVTLAGVIIGFLAFNLRHHWRKRASVFMGDAGSTMLGYVLSWLLIKHSQGGEQVMAPITAAWILAVPLLDTVTLMIRRCRAGHSPFSADRYHLHHLLQAFGWSDGQVTAMLLIGAFTTGWVGAIAWWWEVPDYVQFYAFVALFLLYYQVTGRIWAHLGIGTTRGREARVMSHLRRRLARQNRIET